MDVARTLGLRYGAGPHEGEVTGTLRPLCAVCGRLVGTLRWRDEDWPLGPRVWTIACHGSVEAVTCRGTDLALPRSRWPRVLWPHVAFRHEVVGHQPAGGPSPDG